VKAAGEGSMTQKIRWELDHPTLRLALIEAADIQAAASPESLLEELARAEAALREDPSRFAEAVRQAQRDVLRHAGYKPTGRGKPASEFLLGQALGGGLPRILNLVDINNLASLRHAHPISVFDADALGPELALRFGRPGEHYVFNQSGQSMDVAGLPLIARGPAREAVGNPVKDSMLCKVSAGTRRALYVVYGSTRLDPQLLRNCATDLSELLRRHAGVRALDQTFLAGAGP
jgi:DNA/RNA-binding domain of Phe-tRNA-synthetase-like protein